MKRWSKAQLGGHDMVSRVGIDLVQKVFGLCTAPTAIESDDLMQTRKHGLDRVWRDVETNLHARRGKGS